jgi:hypothetical protein
MTKKKKVYGEGSVTERKDGRWQVSVPGLDGKRRYAYADGEKEAEKLRRQLLSEVEQGKLPPSRQPFQAHVREWLEMKRKSKDYKPNMYINVVKRMDTHFIPVFGHITANVAQERIRHTDIANTLRTYAHVTKRMKDQSTGILQTLFAGEKNTGRDAI